MDTPSTWTALAHDIMRAYKSIEHIEPDEFWKDEQERSDWFEEVASTGRALAELILQADESAELRRRADQLVGLLRSGTSPTVALTRLGFDPESVFSEDPESLSLDDPDNDIIDLATGGIFIQRIGGQWHLRTITPT